MSISRINISTKGKEMTIKYKLDKPTSAEEIGEDIKKAIVNHIYDFVNKK